MKAIKVAISALTVATLMLSFGASAKMICNKKLDVDGKCAAITDKKERGKCYMAIPGACEKKEQEAAPAEETPPAEEPAAEEVTE